MIAKNAYRICFSPNIMEYLVLYSKGMVITDLLLYWTGPSPNGDKDVEINLVCNTTWLIHNPQWGSNLHWISDVKEEMSVNFISHLLDSGFESILEYLGTYLGLDSLEALMLTLMGVSHSVKVYHGRMDT